MKWGKVKNRMTVLNKHSILIEISNTRIIQTSNSKDSVILIIMISLYKVWIYQWAVEIIVFHFRVIVILIIWLLIWSII